jgi:hypothetical protein
MMMKNFSAIVLTVLISLPVHADCDNSVTQGIIGKWYDAELDMGFEFANDNSVVMFTAADRFTGPPGYSMVYRLNCSQKQTKELAQELNLIFRFTPENKLEFAQTENGKGYPADFNVKSDLRSSMTRQ